MDEKTANDSSDETEIEGNYLYKLLDLFIYYN